MRWVFRRRRQRTGRRLLAGGSLRSCGIGVIALVTGCVLALPVRAQDPSCDGLRQRAASIQPHELSDSFTQEFVTRTCAKLKTLRCSRVPGICVDVATSQPTGVEWLIGKWTYKTGSFRDTHELLPGGGVQAPNARGSWSLLGSTLIITWPNGWTNEYPIAGTTGALSGESISPSGERSASTLTK